MLVCSSDLKGTYHEFFSWHIPFCWGKISGNPPIIVFKMLFILDRKGFHTISSSTSESSVLGWSKVCIHHFVGGVKYAVTNL